MRGTVILLDGPIGVGKTSLGRAVAAREGFGFIDGDDHSRPGPWLASILQTSRSIVDAAVPLVERHSCVIIAYPLRCTNWIFFSRTFAKAGIACSCIGLTAGIEPITRRERQLSDEEIARSAEMTTQGYGNRSFAAKVLRTDEAGFEETVQALASLVHSCRAGEF